MKLMSWLNRKEGVISHNIHISVSHVGLSLTQLRRQELNLLIARNAK